ncbi:MAG: Ig-like domain-containing protein, partial [bacterium]
IINSITSIIESTNGSGNVSFDTSVSDLDLNETKLKFEYSVNNGVDWYFPYLLSATPNAGSIDLSNGYTFQVGTVNNVDTSLGPISLSIVWDTRSAQNGSGSLSNIDISNTKIRITPNDLIQDGLAVISDPFILDNVSPTGLTNLASNAVISGAFKNVTLTWNYVTETNFNHYEIWYGVNQNDVDTKSGLSVKWDSINDVNLLDKTTTSTVINGFNEHTIYFKIWAVDNYGNIETLNSISQYINTKPNDPFNLAPTSLTDGSWTADNTPTFSLDLTDPDGGNIKYTIQIDNNQNFSSPELSYTSSFSLNTTRTFTSPELSDDSYYLRVKAIDPFAIESSWSVANLGDISFKVDTTAPTIPGIPSTTSPTASSTPDWVWSASTDISGSGLDTSPYIFDWCGNNTFTSCGLNNVLTTSNTYTHTSGLASGTWYARVKSRDILGNESAYSQIGLVVISTEAPIGSVIINSNDSYTTANSVTLTISATDNFDNSSQLQMMISNRSDFQAANYEAYNITRSWNLDSIEGIKTVYLKFKNTLGTVSSTFSDNIIYDKTPPIDLAILYPLDTTVNTSRIEYRWHIGIDTLSSIAKYRLNVINSDGSFFLLDNIESFDDGVVNSYDRSKYLIRKDGNIIYLTTKDSGLWGVDESNGIPKDGLVNVNLQAFDNAGNIAETQKSFTFDQTPPSLVLNSIDTFTNLNIKSDSIQKSYSITNAKPTFKGSIPSLELSNISILATSSAKPSLNCLVSSSSNWECKFETSLAIGVWKINITATDSVGNIVTLPTITLTIQQEQIETTVIDTPVEPTIPPVDNTSNTNQPLEDGYTLSLTILDDNNKPLVGAIITLPNDENVYITDQNGNVNIKVIEGNYKINIDYKGKNSEQIITVLGVTKEVSKTIEMHLVVIQPNNSIIQNIIPALKTISNAPETQIESISALAISAVAVLAAYPTPITSIPNFFFSYLWFYKRKRKNRYGLIFDADNNHVVPFALVRAINPVTKVIVKDTVSDINGKYSILVDPAKYILQVSLQSYVLFEKQYDATMQNFEQITENIGLVKTDKKKVSKINLRKLFVQISNIIFYIGLFSTTLMLLFNFQPLTAIFMFLYLVQILVILKKQEQRGWGIVIDEETKSSISGAFISILDPIELTQINVQITDKKGRFGFVPDKQLQLLKISASGYEFKSINQKLVSRKLNNGETVFAIESNKVNNLEISMKKTDNGNIEKRAFY